MNLRDEDAVWETSALASSAAGSSPSAGADVSGPRSAWQQMCLAEQSIVLRHRRVWQEKPLLARVYAVWFEALLEGLPAGGRVLEVGAGPAFLSAHARRRRPDLRWITSDLLPSPENDLVVDALRVPLRSASIDALVGFDVLHHLVRPAVFLAEAARVLAPGGKLLLVEPWVTPFSYPIYRWLHHEDCFRSVDPWEPFPPDHSGGKEAFEGNSAVPWKLLRSATGRDWERLGLALPQVSLFNGFAYLLTRGFSGPSLLPSGLAGPLMWLDRRAQKVAGAFAIRAMIGWSRLPG